MAFWRVIGEEPQRQLGRKFYEQRYSFTRLSDILCSKDNIDLIIVTGHNTAIGGGEQGIPKEAHHIRGGNFSDLYFVPKLVSALVTQLCKTCDSYPDAATLNIKMVPSIYLSMNDATQHNLLLLGAGNVNWCGEYIFRKYWQEPDLLPIHFKTIHAHEIIVSELSRREYSTSSETAEIGTDYGILEIVPNPWNATKIVILCCGISLWGTQAAVLALVERKDSKGVELVNNKFEKEYAAKVISANLQTTEIRTIGDIPLKLRTLGQFLFEE